jgi:hypothetical protein
MASPLTIEQFADLTDPRFREIADGIMDAGPDFIPKFYNQIDSDLETERGSALTPIGLFQQFTGVGQVAYDGSDQAYDWQATHVEYALGIQIQRRLWRFDQFNAIEEEWTKLRDSAFETKQIHAAKIFNEGFDVSSLVNFTHSRGESLFADTHATVRDSVSTASGFDNKATAVLSKTSLAATRIQARKLKDDQGRVRGINARTIVVPPDLEFTAKELTQSTGETQTDYNDINVHQGLNYIVWDKLTDATDWWLLDMDALKKNLCWFWADPIEFSRVLDFETYLAKYSGYMQYTTAWKDWRVGIGTEAAG